MPCRLCRLMGRKGSPWGELPNVCEAERGLGSHDSLSVTASPCHLPQWGRLFPIPNSTRLMPWLFFWQEMGIPRHARVPGKAYERRRWRIQRVGFGAAVEMRRAIARQPHFGYRKRGCGATSSPSASAIKGLQKRYSHRKTLILSSFFCFYERNFCFRFARTKIFFSTQT